MKSGVYPASWKKANVVPVFKKDDKTSVKNYRPISLLPILGKLFEKCIYDSIYEYFELNNLFSKCQSGFRKNDSCISQLLAITHEIFVGFDANPTQETHGVFLDISKAFDRVWHKGLLFKLKAHGIDGALLVLIQDFLSDRLQRVVLNGQSSSWREVLAGVPQGSILGPLFFLIFINDLPNNMESQVKIFADDTSLFSTSFDCTQKLNNDLERISQWAYQWKMSFNPDPKKQAVEVNFSKKAISENIQPLIFNNTTVNRVLVHKHLGLSLDSKLNFNDHLKEKIAKANKGIGLIRHLRAYIPRGSLLCIYKSFIRPHLDYADIIYDQPGNDSFTHTIESVQYNAALAITGCIRGTSREKLYNELGLESLSDRRWYRRLIFFYKIINNKSASYLKDYIPQNISSGPYKMRNERPIRHPDITRTSRFRSTFFPYCVSKWNELDPDLIKLSSLAAFKNALLSFVRPTPNSIYGTHNSSGIALLTRLRVGLSHLREHRFRHNFAIIEDPFCTCRTNSIETTEHYLMHCPNFSSHRQTLFNNLHNIGLSPIPFSSGHFTKILLYGDSNFSKELNQLILKSVFEFLITSKRFEGSPMF